MARARHRLAGLDRVTVERRTVPDELPEGPFDLVVLSEVGYFLSPRELTATIAALEPTRRDGAVVACHWLHPVRGWPLDGAAVHRRLREAWGGRWSATTSATSCSRSGRGPPMTRALTGLSVVLPARNEAGRLGDCLTSIGAAISAYAASPGSLPGRRGHRPGLAAPTTRPR